MDMRIFDSHVHLFTPRIIENVVPRTDLIRDLRLEVDGIGGRLSAGALMEEMREAGVHAALMLPTADVAKVPEVNRACVGKAMEVRGLYTAGTLHPDFDGVDAELAYLSRAGVCVIKLCSFSQKFSLDNATAFRMFDRIQAFNGSSEAPFSVVLDTLTLADRYFGSDPQNTTTPRSLMNLVRHFPGIRFIGAHMGGLGAPSELLEEILEPAPNLFLDTSNAAHILGEVPFIRMLRRHGPEHILFGTDWPWFLHKIEVGLIDERMDAAGFRATEKASVFSGNIERILGIPPVQPAD